MIANQYVLMKKMMTYSEMPSFKDVGFKVHSEFEEDGILLYIFSLIGTTNKRVVEICAGDGMQCMAANLIINHGWDGLLFDGEKNNVDKGIVFFASNKSTFLFPPIFKQAWLTVENINHLISENGFQGGIDLLSLDIDGNDYYIMDAINVVRPRVIICETHNVIPSDIAITIPYREDFYYRDGKQHEEFRSVSLLAMKNLLAKKGYRLVGSHRYGFNVIFMLNEVGKEYFPEVSIESVHDNSYTKFRTETAWKEVENLPWVKI
ncbi:Methyltransferase FkbM domain-containing protein [Spirosoma fluviale]|uniref:Methyltransferase FkbM domain-containing protein n=2 Tax=Spirosoma fluviale TaxID=1597977 RepID=A0A286FDE8_9BACT|nr:Methyltransferase FkbM domain-containing protein [Spirosoma fluviale]